MSKIKFIEGDETVTVHLDDMESVKDLITALQEYVEEVSDGGST